MVRLPEGAQVLPDAEAVAREAAERLIAACGSCQSRNALPPSASSFFRRAASSGSSGGANGSLSMTTTDSASPATSTPSQKLAEPSSTALPRRRKRSRISVFEPSPCTSSGKSSPSRASAAVTRSLARASARSVVNSRNARPPLARLAGARRYPIPCFANAATAAFHFAGSPLRRALLRYADLHVPVHGERHERSHA